MSENRPDERFDVFLRHSLSRLPGVGPPPGFAREMGKLVEDMPDKGIVEIFLTLAFASLAILSTGACVFLYFDLIERRVGEMLDRAPWPLLFAAAAVIGAIKMAECFPKSSRG